MRSDASSRWRGGDPTESAGPAWFEVYPQNEADFKPSQTPASIAVCTRPGFEGSTVAAGLQISAVCKCVHTGQTAGLPTVKCQASAGLPHHHFCPTEGIWLGHSRSSCLPL